MKINVLILALALIWAAVPALSGDITGSWEGTTEVPDAPEALKVFMTITKTDDGYAIKSSDSMEMVQKDSVKDVVFEDGKLTYTFTVYNGMDYMGVYMNLTVEADSMTGYWETDDGTSASISFEKVE